MWQLDETQKALVAENLGIAGLCVKRVKTWMEFEDRFSVACLALCRAAHFWDSTKGVKFSTYAVACCTRAIVKESKYQIRVSGGAHVRKLFTYEDLIEVPQLSIYETMTEENIESVNAAIEKMKPTPKMLLKMSLSGMKQRAIARNTGLSRQAVSMSLGRSSERLKRELA